MIEFLNSYAWIVWLALILVFVIIEMLSLELTFLMLALGSLGGLIAGLAGADWWLQIVIAGVLAVVLLGLIRPRLLRALGKGGDPARSNVDALLGIEARIVSETSDIAGLAKLSNGETWTARVSPTVEPLTLEPGTRVLVASIDGATAFVVPATPVEADTTTETRSS